MKISFLGRLLAIDWSGRYIRVGDYLLSLTGLTVGLFYDQISWIVISCIALLFSIINPMGRIQRYFHVTRGKLNKGE
jgi:hypothetical protein